ncbi:unnamed protein product [Arctogadus glacialis]
MSSKCAPTVTDVDRLFFVGLRELNNPDIVATDADPPPPGPTQCGLNSQRLQQSGSGAAGGWWPGAVQSYRNRRVRGGRLEVLAVRSVAVVWRHSLQVEGRPGAFPPPSLHLPGAQGMQNEGLRRRSWRQRAWRRRWPGGPGGGQPGRGGMEGQVAAPHPKGLEAANLESLETAEGLEATAGLEAEANLEVLESVAWRRQQRPSWRRTSWRRTVAAGLEVANGLEAVANLEATVGPEAAASWRARRRRRPGGPGGGGVLEGPEAAASWRARRRRRPGGLAGGGVLEGPAAAAASWRARRRRRRRP